MPKQSRANAGLSCVRHGATDDGLAQTESDMEYTVKELREMLRAATEAEQDAGKAELAALPRTYEWMIKPEPDGFRVTCRLNETSRKAYADWKAAFPTSTQSLPASMEWHGMTYIMLYRKDGTPVLIGGGGSAILSLPGTWGPQPITLAQAEQFENGIVPEELKKAW